MKLKILPIVLFILITFSCKKEITLPIIDTNNAIDITQKSFTTGYTLIDDGGSKITESGICWSLNSLPGINDNKVINQSKTNEFSCTLKELNPETNYYIRAYAINTKGVGYGKIIQVTTLNRSAPVIKTVIASNISTGSFSIKGSLIDDGGSPVTECGFCVDTKTNPTYDGQNNRVFKTTLTDSIFTANINDLDPETEYFVRAYAKNNIGVSYGNELIVKTVEVAFFTNFTVTDITRNSAKFSITINYNNLEINKDKQNSYFTTGFFLKPSSSSSTTNVQIPSFGADGTYSVTVNNLTSGTEYSVKPYASNPDGYSVGSAKVFSTTPDQKTTDIEGNSYRIIKIGKYTWMCEDLKTKTFKNGEKISTDYLLNTSNSVVSSYNNGFKILYNWRTVNDNRGLAPEGWHIATVDEWTDLIITAGGWSSAGIALKSTVNWADWGQNTPPADTYGFTALPNSFRYLEGSFDSTSTGEYGTWWTTTNGSSTENAWYIRMLGVTDNAYKFEGDKNFGISVRCVKDY